MFRVEYAAGISASARDRRPNPTLRRGLCQQTSRIALLSVIGLAAAGGASLLTPDEALAQCAIGVDVDVKCLVSTDTTNTKFVGGPAVNRFYEDGTGVPFTGSVAAGVTIGGHGLAFGNTAAGGVNVVNEGVIRVDAGNAPTEGGAAALNLTAAGGALTYSGGGDIINAGVGDGLVAFQTGAGSIDLNISGDVSAAAGAGVFARHAGDGTATVNVTGKVTGTDDSGVLLISNRGVTLTVADTVTGATGLTVTGGLAGSGDISVAGAGAFVGVNGDGVIIDNLGSGDVVIDLSGPISATGGNGVFVRNSSISGDINVTTGDVSVTGPAFTVLDIVSASEAGNVTVTANGALSGGRQGVSAEIDTALATGNVSVTTNASIDSERGIFASNSGSGSVTVNAAGPITASVGSGITADTTVGAITVTAGDIAAAADGIDVEQSGPTDSSVTITVDGDLNVGGVGVQASILDATSIGEIRVTTNGAVNAATGIDTVNRGSGGIEVTAVGPIVASAGQGISARTAGGAITVTAGDITGVGGIDARQDDLGFGGEAITINATGAITSAFGSGIVAVGNDSVHVTVADTVSGASGLVIFGGALGAGSISVTGAGGFVGLNGDAVFIQNRAAGPVVFDVAGPITSTGGNGVVVSDSAAGGGISITTGDVTADGPNRAILAVSDSVDSGVTVTANGDLNAGSKGVQANILQLASIGDIKVTTNGAVNAATGIESTNRGSGRIEVIATGPIVASAGQGINAETTGGGAITLTAGDVTSTAVGLFARQAGADPLAGTVTVNATGTVNSTAGTGIVALGDAAVNVTVAKTVTGATEGLVLQGGRLGAGDISVTGAGGFVGLNGDAVDIENLGSGDVVFDVSGPIVATGGNGVFVRNGVTGGDVGVTTGDVTVTGSATALLIDSTSQTGDVTVTANGALTGGFAGVQVFIDSPSATGDISIATKALIDSQLGIFGFNRGSGSVTVDAAGPIIASSETGISAMTNGGSITVTAGDITSTDSGIDARQLGAGPDGAAIAINANGTITSAVGIGIVAIGNDAVSVAAAGAVTGRNGLLLQGGMGGAGDLSVTGAGGFVGLNGAAVDIENFGSGDVVFDVSGPIVATGGSGVRHRNTAIGGDVSITTGDVTVTDAGSYNLDISSISETGDVTVTVNGALTGGVGGVVAFNDSDTATGDVSITTKGAIDSGLGIIGAHLGSGSVTVDAAGPIIASGGEGIIATTIDGAVTLTAGDITSTDTGLVARQDDSGAGGAAVTVNAKGTINSAAGTGIVAIGNDAVNVTVAETVTGREGLLLQGGARGAGDISVTGAGGFVGLNGDAVDINNLGSGSVLFDVSGPIVATGGSGIRYRDTLAGGDVSITTGDVTVTDPGFVNVDITSVSQTGNVTLTANGALTGGAVGAVAFIGSETAAGNVSVTTTGAIDSRFGIFGGNRGSGSVTVDAAGPIVASGDEGIFAVTSGGAITVTAGDITAHDDGIFANQDGPGTGAGAITINANGAIASAVGAGIVAFGDRAVNVTVAETVTGALDGLLIEGGAFGSGDISVTGAGGFVSLNGDAVDMNNRGSGSVLFNVSGPIVATGGNGVLVRDGVNGGNISVTTGDVTANGLFRAIEVATQSTTADVTVTANGNLQGGDFGVLAGMLRQTATGDLNVTTNGSINARTGIVAQNFGSGTVTVTAAGPIRTTSDGVSVVAGPGDVTVSAADVVSTGGRGIRVDRIFSGNASDAAVNVTAGDVSGTSGITINTGRGPVSVAINGNVTGTVDEGLQVFGTGAVTATVDGTLTGVTRGALVQAGAGSTGDVSLTGAGSITAQNGQGAIVANNGSGSTTVNLSGAVRATGTGLFVQGVGAVDVTAFDVSGETGIEAFSEAGRVAITSNGSVVGALGVGIAGHAGSASTGLVIDAFNVVGAGTGIIAGNSGVGSTDIHVRGTVEGGTRAITALANGNQTVNILNDGVIRNRSGASGAEAIMASGGIVRLTNAGTLLGDVFLSAAASRFLNEGSWNNIGGDSVFLGANDALENAAGGRILAASGAGALDRTLWRGLERFDNLGRIDLSDGAGGDALITSANAVFQDGSVLAVDIGGANGSDVFATTGTLDIQAGSRLVVNFVEPLALNFRYVVAQADGGLTGRFEMEDQFLTAFLGLRDGYTDTTAFIEIAQLRALAAAGVTPNQKATAAGADSLADDNAVRAALLRLPDDAAAIDAFDQLSGEIHPVARRAMADDSRLPRTAVLDRLADDGRTGSVWGRGFVEERVTDADLNAAKAERDTGGVLFGVDRRLGDSLTVGVAAGRFNTDLNVIDRHSTGRIRTAQGLAYVGGRVGRWGLRAGVGYAETATHTEREIAFAGIGASPETRYDGSVLQGFVDAGYRIALQSGYLEPFASLTNIRAKTDAFTETAGSAALSGEANTDELTISTLGLRFGTRQVGAFALRGSAGWQDMSGDLTPDARHAFDGGSTFTVLGAAQSDRAAVVDLGAQWRLSPNMTMGVAYDGVLGTEGQDHAVSGSFRVAF